jgi:hypothetical protein
MSVVYNVLYDHSLVPSLLLISVLARFLLIREESQKQVVRPGKARLALRGAACLWAGCSHKLSEPLHLIGQSTPSERRSKPPSTTTPKP